MKQELAELVDELAGTAAVGAGALGLHHAEGSPLCHLYLAAASAVGACLGGGAFLCAGASAVGAFLHTVERDFFLRAENSLLKGKGKTHPHVLAPDGAVGTAGAAASEEA